ncbi:MAG: PQQ-binding-like beta-propeller repeat protein, partial [Bacteroidota bacterium]|nr:PQQ-binding-like beta-propeller repeat protein [Bacteroidota bacterium]
MNISQTDKIKLAQRIAWIAAGFALVLAILLIVNYVQTSFNDPIENQTIPALVKRLSENPGDEALKAEIRAFDLMARKAYFTSQWQLRTGTYLMFLSVIISILAVRFVLSAKSKLNEIDSVEEVSELDKLVAQKWVIYTGSGLIVLALAAGLLSSNSLEKYMVNENLVVQEEQPAEIAVAENAEPAVAPEDSSVATGDVQVAEIPVTTDVPVTNIETAAAPAPAGIPTLAQLKANYPFFRGAEGIGVAAQKNTPTDWNGAGGKNVIWKVKVPKSGYSSPIIWGNQLFVTGADAQVRLVYCYDKNTGKLMWEAAADNIQGSPAAAPKVTSDTG